MNRSAASEYCACAEFSIHLTHAHSHCCVSLMGTASSSIDGAPPPLTINTSNNTASPQRVPVYDEDDAKSKPPSMWTSSTSSGSELPPMPLALTDPFGRHLLVHLYDRVNDVIRIKVKSQDTVIMIKHAIVADPLAAVGH